MKTRTYSSDPIDNTRIEEALERINPNWPAAYQKIRRVEALNYLDDHNNCAVITIAMATGVSYGKAQAALARQGRTTGEGTPVTYIPRAMKELGFAMIEVSTEDFGSTQPSFAKIRDASAGRNYMAVTRDHILNIKDGAIYDFKTGRGICKWLYAVTPLPTNA